MEGLAALDDRDMLAGAKRKCIFQTASDVGQLNMVSFSEQNIAPAHGTDPWIMWVLVCVFKLLSFPTYCGHGRFVALVGRRPVPCHCLPFDITFIHPSRFRLPFLRYPCPFTLFTF